MFFDYFSNPLFNPFMCYPSFINQVVFNQQNIQFQQKVHENIILHSQTVSQISKEQNSKVDSNSNNQSILSQVDAKKIRNQTSTKKKQIHPQKGKKHEKKTKNIEKTTRYKKRTSLQQKEGRNSHSNIFRKFFKLLSVESQTKQMIKKIIGIHKLCINQEQFFSIIRIKSIDHRNYIRLKEVINFFESSNAQVSKIMRILFKNYLDNYYMVHLLSSKKTDRKSIILHLQGRRSIKHELNWNSYDESESYFNQNSQSAIQMNC